MRATLAISTALLVAACGRSDPDNDRDRFQGTNAAAPTTRRTVPEASPLPTVEDPHRADVINAVIEAVGEVDRSPRIALGYADIGGDEREEALVYLLDPDWCGSGGCSLIILTPSGNGWRSIGRTTITRLPVHRLRTSREGWNDLAVGVGGGGGPSGTALMRYAKGRYPSNPSVQPMLNRLPEGARLVIADNADALAPAP